jgi:hypothetical protein
MTDEELNKKLNEIKSEIRSSRYDGSWIFILALLFIGGCFKGCVF